MNRIDGTRPDGPELAGFGPLGVGVRTEVFSYPAADVLSGGIRERRLVTEVWYPAAGYGDAAYETRLRDGREITLFGRAAREAAPLPGDYPLVILSHGYPGNRMLLSHFGETLASQGYRVASIDHEESTYDDPAYRGGEAFASTLVHRSGDTTEVARALGGEYAIIGYSMGGYGALVAGGARLSDEARELAQDWGTGAPFALPQRVVPPLLRAIVPIGPWGRQRDFWEASGMAELAVPMFLMAGSEDEISDYDAMRLIFEEARVERHLLTFQGAGHNAAAPIPAPLEAWEDLGLLPFAPFGHYADPVWDTLRMNAVAQHFARAFLDRHLKGIDRSDYLKGFAGFTPGTLRGLTLEHGW